MSNNEKDIGSPDNENIDLSQDYQVRYWTEKLGTTEEALQHAVKEVGPNVKQVEMYLNKMTCQD